MSAQYPNLPPTPQEWLTPASLPYSNYAPPPPSGPAMFELRPLTLSEVLDRTFSLYRSRFWLFAGISAFSGSVQGLAAVGQVLTQHNALAAAANHAPGVGMIVGPLLTLVASLIFYLAYTVTTAATVFAMGEVYLGRETSIRSAFAATIGRWYAYIAIGIWQACSMMWAPLLLLVPGIVLMVVLRRYMWLGGLLLVLGVTVGFVLGYILYLRNAFGIPAAVTERLTIRAAMRRSKNLSTGAKLRMFIVHLISMGLYMVVGVLQTPFSLFMMFAMMKKQSLAIGPEVAMVVIGFLGHTLVAPVAAIGLTLLYFDQRVRLEAFDIAVLLGEENAVEVGAPVLNTSVQPIASQPFVPFDAPANTPPPAGDAPHS